MSRHKKGVASWGGTTLSMRSGTRTLGAITARLSVHHGTRDKGWYWGWAVLPRSVTFVKP